jgi:hypothetical protein
MSLPSQQLLINGNVLDSRLIGLSIFYTKRYPDLTGIEPLDKELRLSRYTYLHTKHWFMLLSCAVGPSGNVRTDM